MKEGRKASPPPEASEFQIKAADAAMFASPRPVRVAAATGHGEWSRRRAGCSLADLMFEVSAFASATARQVMFEVTEKISGIGVLHRGCRWCESRAMPVIPT